MNHPANTPVSFLSSTFTTGRLIFWMTDAFSLLGGGRGRAGGGIPDGLCTLSKHRRVGNNTGQIPFLNDRRYHSQSHTGGGGYQRFFKTIILICELAGNSIGLCEKVFFFKLLNFFFKNIIFLSVLFMSLMWNI